MKRKLLLLCVLLLSVAAITAVTADFHTYRPGGRTIACEPDGLILTITTFNGDSESEPFVRSLGHTWLSLENHSDHSVFLKDYEVKSGELVTFSVWALSDRRGVVFNLEPTFIRQFDRYAGRQSLSVNLAETQVRTIEDFIDRNDTWTFCKNCSYWSVHLWNELTDDAHHLTGQTLVYTPARLQKAMNEFDRVETNRDFSGAGEAFFYRDGERTEVRICP